jgi:hypothetical protein
MVGPAWINVLSAGDADPGTHLRRRRREVALTNIIHHYRYHYLTLTLRLPYAFMRKEIKSIIMLCF